jgi:leucyl/phenylalanyl-tRNA--protein transferase
VLQRRLQLLLSAFQRRRIIEALDAFGSVRIDDDELERVSVRVARLAANEVSVPFVEPNHAGAVDEGDRESSMIPLLGPRDEFPPVDRALNEPNGLLAAGGGLGVTRLIEAYTRGIFPWFGEGDPVLWWCPNPRAVLPTGAVHISRSLKRRLRRPDYRVTFDCAFADVLAACAAPRRDEAGTWLVPAMVRAYSRMHEAGLAHSVEVWVGGELAGGLYGVALGRMFFGESMFTRQTDGSKIAVVMLAAQLQRWGFPMIDCQMPTPHLTTLGAHEISRREFMREVGRLVHEPPVPAPWVLDDDITASFRHAAVD